PIAEPVLESIAPEAPPHPEPAAAATVPARAPRVRRKRAVEVVGETELAIPPGPLEVAPEPEPLVVSPKPRGAGRRRAAVEAPSMNGITSMVPGEPSHVEPESARQTRARRTSRDTRNGLDLPSSAAIGDEIGPPAKAFSRVLEVRPTSRFSPKDAVGRTSFDSVPRSGAAARAPASPANGHPKSQPRSSDHKSVSRLARSVRSE